MRLPAHHPPSTFILQSSSGYTMTLKTYHKGEKNEVGNNIRKWLRRLYIPRSSENTH